MKKGDQKILKRISNNDRHLLDKLYRDYRDPFLKFFKGYKLEEEELVGIYQDSIIAFYQNGVQGKLTDIKTDIKTYLLGIGKSKAIDFLKKKTKDSSIPELEEEVDEIESIHEELTSDQKKLHKHFSGLDQTCQSMLRMFYYRGLSHAEIVKMGNYKNENAVVSQKSKCLKKLRGLANN